MTTFNTETMTAQLLLPPDDRAPSPSNGAIFVNINLDSLKVGKDGRYYIVISPDVIHKVTPHSTNPEGVPTQGGGRAFKSLSSDASAFDKRQKLCAEESLFEKVNQLYIHYQSVRGGKPQMTHLLSDLHKTDLHLHMEGLFDFAMLLEIAIIGGLYWDPTRPWDKDDPESEKGLFVKPTKDPISKQWVKASDLSERTKHYIRDKTVMGGGSRDKEFGCDAFFGKFNIRASIIDNVHLKHLMERVLAYFKGESVRYAEVMAGLSFKRVPDSFEQIWHDSKEDYELFLSNPEVVQWIEDFGKESQASLDEAVAHCVTVYGYDFTDVKSPITVRFTYELMRNYKENYVFLTLLKAICQVVEKDPRVGAMTMCGRQDEKYAQENLVEQVKMLTYMKGIYGDAFQFNPHAGEVVPSSVPPDYIEKERKLMVELASVRMGHFLSGMGCIDLLRKQNITVEVCLPTNHCMYGVEPESHLLSTFLRSLVRVTLCTDDPGVVGQRISDMYGNCAIDYKVGLEDLLNIVRDGPTSSFLKGESIFEKDGRTLRPEFVGCESADWDPVKTGANALLEQSEKAVLQVEFERDRIRWLRAHAERNAT